MLDREAVDALAAEADVLVHLAFIIMGGRDESRRINLEGSANVFAAAAGAPSVQRLVYTSSVAAYGFHADNPQPLTEVVPPRGSDEHYYSAEKAELEMSLWTTVGDVVDTYVFRPCIVAGPDALMPVESIPGLLRRLPVAVLPDTGIPFQVVHHDDVASALVAAVRGAGSPGIYNLAGPGELTPRDLASALGWHSVPFPNAARLARRGGHAPAARPGAGAVAQRVPRADADVDGQGPPRAALAPAPQRDGDARRAPSRRRARAGSCSATSRRPRRRGAAAGGPGRAAATSCACR